MASNSLQQQIASMRQSFFDEGILNEQFIQLENLEDENNPNFVMNALNIYFTNSPIYIDAMEQMLDANPVNIIELDSCLQTFKNNCTSIGAKNLIIGVDKILQCCLGDDKEGSITALQSMKQEYNTLKNKLEAYLKLLGQAAPAQSPNGKDSGNEWYLMD